MDTITGHPLTGAKLKETQLFLNSLHLDWEDGVEFTVSFREKGELCATASRQGNVFKCIAIAPTLRGEGLAATLLTHLTKDALEHGYAHCFLYTKPENLSLFTDLGFYPVAQTKEVALLENKKGGISSFIAQLTPKPADGTIGCIVANCNPFTNGHLHLIEQAAASCDFLHLFILSEDKSQFSAETRMELAKKGTAHIDNIAIHPTGSYLVSSSTFPHYFLDDSQAIPEVQCQLDVLIFAQHFAPALHITKRFVGTEPHSHVTNAYNNELKRTLPSFGIEVVERPRIEVDGLPISASSVRKLLAEHRLEDIRPLVPATTYAYLEGLVQHGQ